MVCEILKKGVGPVLLLLLISACGEIGGSGQCGGGEETGSCVRIESITPKYFDKNTSSVDVVQVVCDASATTTTLEPFASHSADLVISNRPIPPLKKEDVSDVTIQSYSISYTLNNCPPGAICPALRPVVGLLKTLRVPVDSPVTASFSFFDLSSKDEYSTEKSGTLSDVPRYIANYRLTGTDSHKNPISVEGSTQFEIGGFNNCAS